MNICLSHWSALECWRGIRRLGVDYLNDILQTPRTSSVSSLSPSISEREARYVAERYLLSFPLELAVGDWGCKRVSQSLSSRKANPKAISGWLICLEEGLYIPDPVFCLLQMSSLLTLLELTWLGYEMTSIFALEQCYEGAIIDSAPLFGIDEVLPALSCLEGVGNRRKATKAIKYVKPFAASPPEIEMSMKLGLPHRYGGEALDCHELNTKLSLREESQSVLGKAFCRADILFPDIGLDLEYQSDAWHLGPAKRTEDDCRRNVLVREGCEVVYVYGYQLQNPEEMAKLAQSIFRLLSRRYRPDSASYAKRQCALYKMFRSGSVLPRKT